jgi:8-amino-7-oxononanoate synthase
LSGERLKPFVPWTIQEMDFLDKAAFIKEELETRRRSDRLRTMPHLEPLAGGRLKVDGSSAIDFCSNDYLGLSKHPLLRQRAREFMDRYGAGSTSSRLICGNYHGLEEVEKRLAELKGCQAALLFSSGTLANLTVLPALVDTGALVLSDRLNHHSLIQGARLSRCCVQVFEHNDLDHLQALLKEKRSRFSRVFILTESVFSMDGDRSDLDGLESLARTFNAWLLVDEAHASGLFGPNGMGLGCGLEVDLSLGTFGKALGSQGAYVACTRQVREYLVNRCGGFIYTTGLSPAILGSISAALELVPQMDAERAKVQENAAYLRKRLRSLGYDTLNSSTQIVPVVVGSERKALLLAQHLLAAGFFAPAIRPPAVEAGKCRIRLTVSLRHTRQDLDALLEVFSAGA